MSTLTLGELPLQTFEQWYRKQIKESKDEDIRIPKKTENDKYIRISDYENTLKERDTKWFSRSQMYYISKKDLIFQNPSFQIHKPILNFIKILVLRIQIILFLDFFIR
jgi:hypothetical protein